MALIPENQRIAALRELGVSEPLIRLASGECIHPEFRYSCLGPPHYVYHGAEVPDGPPLLPLWDCNDTVVGIRMWADGPEFLEFSIEAADEVYPLARTEQGFWASRFDFLYESDVPDQELREAAAAVGFQFLGRLVASREASVDKVRTFEGHAAWRRELVASIDSETGFAELNGAPDPAA